MLIYNVQLFAQTYKADYVLDNNGNLAAAQTTHASNIFSPNVTVDNLANVSFAGAVTWSSGNGITLQETGFQSTAAGTAFYINFTFLPGYTYNISITATSNYLSTNKNTLTSLNTSIVPNTNQYPTSGNTATSPDTHVPTYNLLGIGQSTFYPQNPSNVFNLPSTYNIPQFTVPSGSTPNVFMIWTGGSTGTNNLIALISAR